MPSTHAIPPPRAAPTRAGPATRRLGLAALLLFWFAPLPTLAEAVLSQDELVELEELLETLDFAPGAVDGVVDAKTRAAIGRYHEFAFLSGQAQAPSRDLLEELRGVAGRIAAIEAGERVVEPDNLLALGGGTAPDAPQSTETPTSPSDTPSDAVLAGPTATTEPDEEPAPPADGGPADPTDGSLPDIEPSESLRAALPPPPPPAPETAPTKPQATTAPADRGGPAEEFLDDALVSLQAGEVERAVALLTAALSFDPDNVVAYQLRGSALTFKGDFASAIRDFDKAAELDPENPEVYQNRCWVLGQAGRYEGALRDCDRALELNASSAAAHHSRAQVFEAMGKPQDALADYAEALRLDPDSPEVAEDARRVGLIE